VEDDHLLEKLGIVAFPSITQTSRGESAHPLDQGIRQMPQVAICLEGRHPHGRHLDDPLRREDGIKSVPILIRPHPRQEVREEAGEHRREAHRDLHVLPPLGQDDIVAASMVPRARELELKNRDEVTLVTQPDVHMSGGWVVDVRVPRRQVGRGLATPTPLDHWLVRRHLVFSRTLGEDPAYAVDWTPILPFE